MQLKVLCLGHSFTEPKPKHTGMDLPPLMQATPGITEKRFTADPLGTEGELTPGPDDANPFRSADEREIVDAYKAKQAEYEKADLHRTTGIQLPFMDAPKSPTAGDDPFVFDDVGEEVANLRLPFTNSDGPQF